MPLGLCALACYDRDELHSNVITNASFKQLVEAEPQLREVMLSFYSSNYTRCFSIMDEMRNNCILDMYISSHVDTLYQARNVLHVLQPSAPSRETYLRN